MVCSIDDGTRALRICSRIDTAGRPSEAAPMRTARWFSLGVVAGLAALLAAACDGSGSDDPRCTSLCTIKDASAGDVCSQASADACLEQCGAHIEGTTAACGDCLLEKAHFGTDAGTTSGGSCDPTAACPDGACTETGPGGSCTYCANDMTAAQNCYATTHPHREVTCETKFRPTTDCSALCAAQ